MSTFLFVLMLVGICLKLYIVLTLRRKGVTKISLQKQSVAKFVTQAEYTLMFSCMHAARWTGYDTPAALSDCLFNWQIPKSEPASAKMSFPLSPGNTRMAAVTCRNIKEFWSHPDLPTTHWHRWPKSKRFPEFVDPFPNRMSSKQVYRTGWFEQLGNDLLVWILQVSCPRVLFLFLFFWVGGSFFVFCVFFIEIVSCSYRLQKHLIGIK